MKKAKQIKKYLFIILLFVSSNNIVAQTKQHTDSIHHKERFHSISFVMANAFVPNSFTDKTNDILVVPVFGLNYDYQINNHWGFGLHTDIILQQFIVEKHGNQDELIRENPFALTAIVFFKPHHRWKILGGYGIEMEKNENFQLVRIGVEYGIELPNNWELGFTIENDFKLNAYNTTIVGVGFSKTLSKKNKA
jgi:hypothetical protein